jgi:hypothetical protein
MKDKGAKQIHCFHGEKSRRDKGMKGIKEWKEGDEV